MPACGSPGAKASGGPVFQLHFKKDEIESSVIKTIYREGAKNAKETKKPNTNFYLLLRAFEVMRFLSVFVSSLKRIPDIEMQFPRAFAGAAVDLLAVVDAERPNRRSIPDPRSV
jgi:hypothetical protein